MERLTPKQNELLGKIHKNMQSDDRYPVEVVKEQYQGDWKAYLKDMRPVYAKSTLIRRVNGLVGSS